MRDTLFLGYTDPLIDLLNSPMVTYLQTKVINGSLLGFPVPDIKVLGYFADYNGTNDEDYVADTGKKEPMHIGKIREWANATSLEWWGNNYTNDISGSVGASIRKPSVARTLLQMASTTELSWRRMTHSNYSSRLSVGIFGWTLIVRRQCPESARIGTSSTRTTSIPVLERTVGTCFSMLCISDILHTLRFPSTGIEI